MRYGKISDRDSLFRSLVFPLTFGGKNNKEFRQKKFLNLKEGADGAIIASLVWERYVPTITQIHCYGCRLASRMNEKERAKKGYRDKDRRIYCGAYHLKAKMIRALATTDGLPDVLSADVIHQSEDGEIAHACLRIVLKPEREFDAEGTKTAIFVCIWNACHGPLIHICDCDKDVADHPSLSLTIPPAGPYCDTRPLFLRLWHIVRYHAFSWILHSRTHSTAPNCETKP